MSENIDTTLIPQNEIWYTTHNGMPLDNEKLQLHRNQIISNSYSEGKGVVVYAKNITTITKDFLSCCEMVKSISLPWGVEKIIGGRTSTFLACGIEKIDLPDTIVVINNAFSYCKKLTHVILPQNLEKVTHLSFTHCTKLQRFEGKYASEDGRCLIVKNTLVAFAPAGLTEYTIPKNVRRIDWCVFSNCSALKRIILPKGLTSIGGLAFENCVSLVDINLPPKLKRIGDKAFHNCRLLKSVIFPKQTCENHVCWGNFTFKDCVNLESVTFEDDIIAVPLGMFDGCTSLKNVVFAEKPRRIDRYAFRNCTCLTSIEYRLTASVAIDAFIGCDNLAIVNGQPVKKEKCLIKDGRLIQFLDTDAVQYTIPENVTCIGIAFENCINLKSIKIGKNVKTIEMYAFAGCKNLEQITFNDGLQEISQYAFDGCSKLTNIILPEGLRTIEAYAFRDCTSLASVTVPSTLIRVGEDVFEGCHNLERFQGENTSKDGRCLILHEIVRAFAPANLTEYTIPDGVRGVYSGFVGCKNLTTLTFPPTVQTFFPKLRDCSSLHTVNIPEGIKGLDVLTFVRCASLTSLTFPNSLHKLSGTTFNGCIGLKEFRGKFSSADHRCIIIDGELVRFASVGLTEYTVPDGVTTIGWAAFAHSIDLERVTLPKSVEQIDGWAFASCENLKEIYIQSNKLIKFEDSSFDKTPLFRIFVPNKKLKTYQKSKKWALYTDNLIGYDF